MAADIVATAVTPTWESIASLGSIAGIRTFLNYFLRQEVKELEVKKQKNKDEQVRFFRTNEINKSVSVK